MKEILYDLSIGIFSAMILVWFIDEIQEKIMQRQEQENEKKVIKGFNKILSKYIEQYILAFYCVATPLLKRDFKKVEMPDYFMLKDMCD